MIFQEVPFQTIRGVAYRRHANDDTPFPLLCIFQPQRAKLQHFKQFVHVHAEWQSTVIGKPSDGRRFVLMGCEQIKVHIDGRHLSHKHNTPHNLPPPSPFSHYPSSACQNVSSTSPHNDFSHHCRPAIGFGYCLGVIGNSAQSTSGYKTHCGGKQ